MHQLLVTYAAQSEPLLLTQAASSTHHALGDVLGAAVVGVAVVGDVEGAVGAAVGTRSPPPHSQHTMPACTPATL